MAKRTHSGGGRTPTEQRVRTGGAAKGVNPGYADQLGQRLLHDAHRTPMREQAPHGASIPLGNQVALNVGKGGPGAGRTIHTRGSQGHHGPANPGSSPPARDILSEFGKERSR
jgi:hypothetical protein